MRTIKLRINSKKKHSTITIPPDLIEQEGLKDGEAIVIAYICKAGEEI